MPESFKKFSADEPFDLNARISRQLRPLKQPDPTSCGITTAGMLAKNPDDLKLWSDNIAGKSEELLTYSKGNKIGMDPYTLAKSLLIYRRLSGPYYKVSVYVDDEELESIYNGENTRGGRVIDETLLRRDEEDLASNKVSIIHQQITLRGVLDLANSGKIVIINMPGVVGHWGPVYGSLNVVFSDGSKKLEIPLFIDPFEGKDIYDEDKNEYIAHLQTLFGPIIFGPIGINRKFIAIVAEPQSEAMASDIIHLPQDIYFSKG